MIRQKRGHDITGLWSVNNWMAPWLWNLRYFGTNPDHILRNQQESPKARVRQNACPHSGGIQGGKFWSLTTPHFGLFFIWSQLNFFWSINNLNLQIISKWQPKWRPTPCAKGWWVTGCPKCIFLKMFHVNIAYDRGIAECDSVLPGDSLP